MKEAANFLLGSHDFRNLCKMDVDNGVIQFVRTIDEANIIPVDRPTAVQGKSKIKLNTQLNFMLAAFNRFTLRKMFVSEYEIMKLIIKSRGFLYHQIRCIMAVLFMVGEGNEDSSIIKDLLDVEKNPSKPQYQMAVPEPLSLAQVEYENLGLNWVHSPEEDNYLCGQLQRLWTEFATKCVLYLKPSVRYLLMN